MDNKETAEDDKSQWLHQLAQQHGASIVSQLVRIGHQDNHSDHLKSRSFINNLECLQPDGTELRRLAIDAECGDYVAVSYTWSTPVEEAVGGYRIQNWGKNGFDASPVRDSIFERTLRYMEWAEVSVLWIDRHCICQVTHGRETCEEHGYCVQKRDALPAMDLVYQLSKHPIALLGHSITSAVDLDLLAGILLGKLVEDASPPRLSRATDVNKARAALQLLYKITQDSWWWRAWTFQENYRGGKRMRLLIRHDSTLELQKLGYEVFGDIDSELLIPSVEFSKEATRLCKAFCETARPSAEDNKQISDIFQAAGRYTVLLKDSETMTSTVVADIEVREMKEPWDRLAIIANCCQYSLHLETAELIQQGHSLSLSVLAMCLINGEILENDDNSGESAAQQTTSSFLQKWLYKEFSAPKDEYRRLTFNKGCRLTGVELRLDGISAKGHLWKLSRKIEPWELPSRQKRFGNSNSRLTIIQQKCLLQLVHYLEGHDLKNLIYDIMVADLGAKGRSSLAKEHMHRMAVELAAAIESRRTLVLGCIWDPTGGYSPYRAIFVLPKEDERQRRPPPTFVFTSTWFGDDGTEAYDKNDIDRHVSLEVMLEGPRGGENLPRLRIGRWVHGLCFFEECRRTKVVFPWPRALLAV